MIRAIVSEVPLMKGIVAVMTGFAFVVFVNVAFNKVWVVVVLTEALSRYLVSSVNLSVESQTSCARLVKVRMVNNRHGVRVMRLQWEM